ncbi:Hypothetical protein NCS54_00828800 [Fusarium falciforme]|uniref:Hypothetical protein n=1 Tax=Fusarium falciforme TaxID=195108 RepID=UPI0023019C42|nr:Hypothetical protein NCS54_00828800 [Fusarium falciforme]WAO90845.1 Hypothetical protein NCS54_00828800 [Fusarium falciforme]
MAEDTGWEPVEPEGLALGTYATTVILSVLCTIVVLMRTFVRARNRCLGTDDHLMVAGWASYIVHNVIVIVGCHRGIGTVRRKLTDAQVREGMKYVFLWQIFYAATLVCVKSSICVTVLRIATGKVYVWLLRGLIGLSILMSSVGFIVIMAQCQPVEAFWDPSRGKCMNKILPMILTYAASAANVITDFAVATIPMVLVRKLQMRSKLKLYAQLIMGLGVLASIASIIRVPYSNAYLQPANFVYSVANIILWTVVEYGVGIIAGSLPSLRAFFKSLAKDKSTQEYSGSHHTDLLTIGRVRDRQTRSCRSHGIELGPAATATVDYGDTNQERDDDSTRHIIKATREFGMERSGSDEEELYQERETRDPRLQKGMMV